jgi:type IV secretory pathway VirB4 component
MGEGQLGAFHKSIIDRCTASIYREFVKSGGKARQPVLSDWRNEVKAQPEQEAQELALASELFVEGSLNMFAHETNVDIHNRIVSFDLYEMGEQLKPTALTVTMETIQNRVAANRLAGKYTWVFIDEIYLFFRYYYSAQFLYKCWKRFRKYAAAMTGATQNMEECLRSDTARLMFANSEFLVLLNQAATDRAELAKLLNISETQMSHVTGAEAGHGLLRVGSSIVPFANEFPRSGELYRLWSTTPGDK